MNITVLLALAIALLGLVVYLVVANPKAQEVGRISFAMGLLAFLLAVDGRALHIGVSGSPPVGVLAGGGAVDEGQAVALRDGEQLRAR